MPIYPSNGSMGAMGPSHPLSGSVNAETSVATIQAIAARLGLRPGNVIREYMLGNIDSRALSPEENQALSGMVPNGVRGLPSYSSSRRDLRAYERTSNVRRADQRQQQARAAQVDQRRRLAEVTTPEGRQRLATAMAQGSPVASPRERRMAQARWAASEAPENLGVAFQGLPVSTPQERANYQAGQNFANAGTAFLTPENQAALAAAFNGWGPGPKRAMPRPMGPTNPTLANALPPQVGIGPSAPPRSAPPTVQPRAGVPPLLARRPSPVVSGPAYGYGSDQGPSGPVGPQGPPGARALRQGPMGPIGPVAARGMSVKGAKGTVDRQGYTRIEMPRGALKKLRAGAAKKKQADLKAWYDAASKNEAAVAAEKAAQAARDAANNGGSASGATVMPNMAQFDQAGQQAMDRVNGVYADAEARYKMLMDQNSAQSAQVQASLNRDMMNRYADMSKSVASGNTDLAAQGFAPTADMQQAGTLQLQALQNAGQAQNTWASNMGTLANTMAADRIGSIGQSKAAYMSGIAGQVAASKADAMATAAGGGGGGGGGGGSSSGDNGVFGPGTFNYAEHITKLDAPTEYQRAIETASAPKSMPLMQEVNRRLRGPGVGLGANPRSLYATTPKRRKNIRSYLKGLIPLYDKQRTYGVDNVLANRDTAVAGRGTKRAGY